MHQHHDRAAEHAHGATAGHDGSDLDTGSQGWRRAPCRAAGGSALPAVDQVLGETIDVEITPAVGALRLEARTGAGVLLGVLSIRVTEAGPARSP